MASTTAEKLTAMDNSNQVPVPAVEEKTATTVQQESQQTQTETKAEAEAEAAGSSKTTTTTAADEPATTKTVDDDNDDNSNNDITTTKEKEEEQTQKTPEEQSSSSKPSCWKRFVDFYWSNEFLILIVIVILLARAYPPLGAVYLKPEITSTWIAVIFIFVLAGLGLKTKEFSKAFQRLHFNIFVQIYNFGVVSSLVYGISRGLIKVGAIAQSLGDGMVVCSCLPLTINMVLVLTKSSGGDEASAIFNAAFGNMLGVFLSPVLILGYLGVTGDVKMGEIFYKLALRVVLPVCVGQLLQKFCPPVVQFVTKYKKYFKQAQQYCLVYIVYTVFCRTFNDGNNDASIGDIFVMIVIQFCLLILVMVLAWYLLKLCFRNEPTLRVMGLYGCTHKTVAMGVPLINAIYENNPLVGLYTLPLLIWHPMQLVVGSFLAPRLSKWVESEKERLDWPKEDEEEEGGIEKDNNVDVEQPNNNTTDTTPGAASEEQEQSATFALQSMLSVSPRNYFGVNNTSADNETPPSTTLQQEEKNNTTSSPDTIKEQPSESDNESC